MSVKSADETREKRRAERLDRLAASTAAKPNEEASQAAAEVAGSADGKMKDFIDALVDRMNADGQAGKPLFVQSLKNRPRVKPSNQEETMRAALQSGMELGHSYRHWYREKRAPHTDHLVQNPGVYTTCEYCKKGLIVRLAPVADGQVPKTQNQDPTPIISGGSLSGTCMKLQGKKAAIEQLERVASPAPSQ